MKIYRMNEMDAVLHNSFEEAMKYYDDLTGIYEECKDNDTGDEYETTDYLVYVHEHGDEPLQMSVQKGIDKGLIDVPTCFTSEE